MSTEAMRADAVHSTSVALEFAAVHAEANEVPKVVAFEPRWVHVAYEGRWRGYRTGEFTFTPSDLRQMVANLRASPQYRPNSLSVTKDQILGGQYGVIRFDFRHLSEMPPAEVPIGHQVAFGWVLEAEVRTANEPGDASGVRAKSDKAEFWAFGYFGTKAADMINNHEIKWLSITAYPNSTDKVTAANVGWRVSSIALTPSPFLEDLTALPFQAEHVQAEHDIKMEQQIQAERDDQKSKNTDRSSTEAVGTKNNERPKADDNGSKNVDRKPEGKKFMKLSKKAMETMKVKAGDEDNEVELSHAVDNLCMEHSTMSKQLADMTAKCAEYEKQFGTLKKACGDVNMPDGQIGVVLADAMSAKTRYEAELPKFKIVLETSIASEKLDAKADIERVMAEGQIDPKFRDMVESFRLGGIPNDKLTTPEALAIRLEARKTYLSKYPHTGDAPILADLLGGKGSTHIDTGVQASAQGNGQGGIGFGTASRPSTKGQQPKTIMLSDENRVERPINLRDYSAPGAEFNPIMCAVTMLKSLFPTKYGKATGGTVAWDELNMEAYQVVCRFDQAGAL